LIEAARVLIMTPMRNVINNYVTIEEAGARLGQSAATIRRRLADGTLPSVARYGRRWIESAAVDRLAKRREPAPRRGIEADG
jgi:excisionase family DNA binding protein